MVAVSCVLSFCAFLVFFALSSAGSRNWACCGCQSAMMFFFFRLSLKRLPPDRLRLARAWLVVVNRQCGLVFWAGDIPCVFRVIHDSDCGVPISAQMPAAKLPFGRFNLFTGHGLFLSVSICAYDQFALATTERCNTWVHNMFSRRPYVCRSLRSPA